MVQSCVMYVHVGDYIGQLVMSLDGTGIRRVIGFVSHVVAALKWVWSVSHVFYLHLSGYSIAVLSMNG